MKSNKSFLKRLRVTRNGKVIARVPGHNHFNSKDSGTAKQRRNRTVNVVFKRVSKARFLPR